MSKGDFTPGGLESSKFAAVKGLYYQKTLAIAGHMAETGMYKVVRNSLPYFWEHMTPGGVVISDQYNLDIAPGETRAGREVLPHAVIRTFPNGRMPTAYVIKD